MANESRFIHLYSGWEANALAERAHQVRTQLEAHRRRSVEKMDRYQTTREVPTHMMIVFWIMAVGWAVVTYVEWLVSKDIYSVYQNSSEADLGPAFFAVALAFAGVVLSALICELFHPMWSVYFSRRQSDPYRNVITGRNKKPIDWRYAYFVVGVAATVALTSYLYTLSSERVSLEVQAGIATDGLSGGVWVAPVLFLWEVALGLSLPFVVSAVNYRLAAANCRRKDQRLARRHHDLVTKTMETYAESVVSREQSESTVAPAPVSIRLRRLIEERFGETGPEAPNTEEGTAPVRDPETEAPTDTTTAEARAGTHREVEERPEQSGNDAETMRMFDELVESQNSEL